MYFLSMVPILTFRRSFSRVLVFENGITSKDLSNISGCIIFKVFPSQFNMKHIKFNENIEADKSYADRGKPSKRESEFSAAPADSGYDDNYDLPPSKKWFEESPDEPPSSKPLSSEEAAALKKEASSLLHGESLAYETKINRSGSSDQKWARSLLTKGAMADRVAAATILIQDSPMHHLSTIQNLVSMVKPAKKKDSITVIETLSELFINDLLIPSAKLRAFEGHSLSELDKMCSGNKDHRRKILLAWMFEDQLKESYAEFIKCLNNFAHDTIETNKEKAVSSMSKLLMHNPEMEKVLLSSIVNKLGDPSQKVASKVIYHLCQVLFNHPNMKSVVLDEIEKLLFRPNIAAKAQYYGVCFLNQFYLSKDDGKVAENLIRVYFSFFRACIKKGEIDSRLMGAILTGVRRCQPFLSEQALTGLQQQSHALHRLVHLAHHTVALHALALLLQMQTPPSDRFYCALYKKLCDPDTLTTTLPALLMSVVYRAVKADDNQPRVVSFIKRLLQLATLSDAPRACALLLMVARLARNKKLPIQWTEKTEQDAVKEEEVKEETAEAKEENEALKEDLEKLDKELTEIDKEDAKTKKRNKKKKKNKDEESADDSKELLVKQEEDVKANNKLWIGDKLDLLNEDDDEEVYEDVPLEEDMEDHKKKMYRLKQTKASLAKSWLHSSTATTAEHGAMDNKEETEDEEENKKEDRFNKKDVGKQKEFEILIKKTMNRERVITEYNAYNRNPAYCGAEHSVICEAVLLLEHYHPTVRLFAEKILNGKFISYSGDPLKDFSIARFLDRFAFKNPKKDPVKSSEVPAGPTTIKGSHPHFAKRKNYLAGGMRSLPINSAAYLNENSDHVPVDERFLYDYLQMRRQTRGEDSDNDSDADSVNSEEFERYLDGISGKAKELESEESGDEAEEEMDYMKDMLEHSKASKEARRNKSAKQEEGGESEASEESDAMGYDEEDDMMSDMDDDDDEGPDLDFSNDDDGDDDEPFKRKKGSKSRKGGDDDSDLDFSEEDDADEMLPQTKKKGKKGMESMFASAEEFATILEETGTSRKHGTSQAVSNTDNANLKQLNWEERRNSWVKGYDKKKKFDSRRPGSFKNKKQDGGAGKRKFNAPAGDKAKKHRRN